MTATWVYRLLFAMATFTLWAGCQPIEEAPAARDQAVLRAIDESMQDWYYWKNHLPVSLDLSIYESPSQLLGDLIKRPEDRWSYLTTPQAFQQAISGQSLGTHGFGWGLDPEGKLYISFVYQNSPAGEDGWQRGWQITAINGTAVEELRNDDGSYTLNLGPNEAGVENSFTFRLPDGSTSTRTISKGNYRTNSVLHREVLHDKGKRIGYWVYQSFRIDPQHPFRLSAEVQESMQYFQAEHVEELIIDLRYNGGGAVNVAEQILNYLVPSEHSGKIMYTNTHNPDKINFNRSVTFQKSGNLELQRVYFIVARGSASASELVINCIRPYLETILVGQNTYGKPVGSFAMSNYHPILKAQNVELVPITFSIANAAGEANYFEGFSPDLDAADDPTRNWGDLYESKLRAALQHIHGESTASHRAYNSPLSQWAMIDDFEGLRKEFPVY